MENTMNKEYKIIFNSGIMRHLLKDYNIPIADIKADKNNSDKTVYVVKRTPEFEKAFAEINGKFKNKNKKPE